MTGLTAALVVNTVMLTTGAQPYKQAYEKSNESGRPLLVLVGADWCPGCITMKQSTIPSLQRNGKLANVEITLVNTDHDQKIARKLMRGGTIPQLILFEKTRDGWKRQDRIGVQSETAVEALIRPAVERHASTRTEPVIRQVSTMDE